MNMTGVNDDNNKYNFTTLAGNHSYERRLHELTIIDRMSDVILYVVLTLGIPGNVLSTIIWLRRHIVYRNSSAVYLVALSINDIIYLLRMLLRRTVPADAGHRLGSLWRDLGESARILEPLLVLSFSVERLFAILRPLQVGELTWP